MNNCKYCGKFTPLDNIKSGYQQIYSGYEVQEVEIFHRECQILYIAKQLIQAVDNGIAMNTTDIINHFQIDRKTAIKAISKAYELTLTK